MMTINPVLETADNDADLVAQSLAGSRDAFGTIVSRYQSLVCSIAYSATGCLSQSEDLAQETFVAAWKQLRQLREPAKLRAWLCGIARNLVHNTIRREGREPVAAAEPIEFLEEAPAVEPLPAEQTISREEEAILWRSLERIPPLYREPLVLFYREQQSIERVSAALGLSEDAVKQRLSRGRKLLQEQVAAFVEGALGRSSPGKAFTLGVLAAIPLATTSVSAATVAATAAKGSPLAKSAGIMALINLLLTPVASFLGAYLGMRAGLNMARTGRERQYVFRVYKEVAAGVVLYLVALTVFLKFGDFWMTHPSALAVLGIALPVCYIGWFSSMVVRTFSGSVQIRAEEEKLHPEAFRDEAGGGQEYRSAWQLFGLPLIHIRLGHPTLGGGPAKGWIAIGDRAVGVLFAMGGVACGGISVGAISAGIISVGGLSLGLISMGCMAAGVLSLGSMVVGKIALGAVAVGWTFASGSLAVSHQMAMGAHALALHANDAVAKAFFAQHSGDDVVRGLLWFVVLATVVPSGWMAWSTGRRRRNKTAAEVSPASQPAERKETRCASITFEWLKSCRHSAGSEACDTAGLETCATSADPASSDSGPRNVTFDYLRAFVTLLVVAHHAVLAYHPYAPAPASSITAEPRLWPAFPVVDSHRWPGIDLFVWFNDTFFMSLMFLVSGLFVWPSLKRKGARRFLRDRVLRLGMPFALGAALLAPLAYYPAYRVTTAHPSFAEFWKQWTALGVWPSGPVWFIWVLIVFGGAAAALFHAMPRFGEWLGHLLSNGARRPGAIFGTVVALSGAVYLPMANWFDPVYWGMWGPFAVQTSRLFHYALYFFLGIGLGACGLDRGLLAPDGKLARRWPLWIGVTFVAFACSIVSVLTVFALMAKGQAATGWRILANSAFVLSCAASNFLFLALFVRFVRLRTSLFDSLSRNAYGIYLTHYAFVSWLQLALLGTAFAGAVKGSLVFTGALALSWAATSALRRLPGVGRII